MNINKLTTTLTAFGIAVFFSTSAFAQSQDRQERREPPTFEELLEKMDTDEDGKLSKNEAKGRLKKAFEKIDADEDGFITEEEFKKAPRPERRPKRQ